MPRRTWPGCARASSATPSRPTTSGSRHNSSALVLDATLEVARANLAANESLYRNGTRHARPRLPRRGRPARDRAATPRRGEPRADRAELREPAAQRAAVRSRCRTRRSTQATVERFRARLRPARRGPAGSTCLTLQRGRDRAPRGAAEPRRGDRRQRGTAGPGARRVQADARAVAPKPASRARTTAFGRRPLRARIRGAALECVPRRRGPGGPARRLAR